MSQQLPIVGPAGTGPDSLTSPDSPETHSIITIQRVRLKNRLLTCEFTEQRTQEAPPRVFALTCAE